MQNLILILGLILCVQSLSGCSDTNTQPLDIKRFEIDITKLDSFKDAEKDSFLSNYSKVISQANAISDNADQLAAQININFGTENLLAARLISGSVAEAVVAGTAGERLGFSFSGAGPDPAWPRRNEPFCKKSRMNLRLLYGLCLDGNLDDDLAVVLHELVVAGALVPVAREHDVEHARPHGDRRGCAGVEVIVVLGILAEQVELLHMRPGHALAAGDAVLQVDVLLVRFQVDGLHRTRVSLRDGRKKAAAQLIAAGFQIGRFRQERKGQLHIGVQRVIALLLLNAINNHRYTSLNGIESGPFHYKAIDRPRQVRAFDPAGGKACARLAASVAGGTTPRG